MEIELFYNHKMFNLIVDKSINESRLYGSPVKFFNETLLVLYRLFAFPWYKYLCEASRVYKSSLFAIRQIIVNMSWRGRLCLRPWIRVRNTSPSLYRVS